MKRESAERRAFYMPLVADLIVKGQEENASARALYDHVFELLWPRYLDLLAQVAEYEHALEHVTDPHPDAVCLDCQRLAQSAIDGVNRADFREMVEDL